MKRPRQKYIFRFVSKTNRGHVSMPVLLRISEMCERICRLAGEVGCGGAPNLEMARFQTRNFDKQHRSRAHSGVHIVRSRS
jgi:hypothetical protein